MVLEGDAIDPHVLGHLVESRPIRRGDLFRRQANGTVGSLSDLFGNVFRFGCKGPRSR